MGAAQSAEQITDELEDKDLRAAVVRTDGFDEEKGCHDVGVLKRNLRVLFIHGGGSKVGLDLSQQPLAHYLRAHFTHHHTERVVDTSRFPELVAQQASAIYRFQPDVIVTHSQGGPTIRKIIELGLWSGPTLMLAPALVPGIDDFVLARSLPVIAAFGDDDIQVPLSVRDLLMEKNAGADPDSELRCYTIEARHSMSPVMRDSFHPSLLDMIVQLWQMKANNARYGPHANRIPESKSGFPLTPLRTDSC